MRTFKVELKQKQKFRAKWQAKTGFEGEKVRETIHFAIS